MEYVLLALLVTAGIFFVVRPIVSKSRYRFEFENVFDFGDTKQLDYLNSKKARVLENIRELDFEYEMGKLSDEDYSSLRNDYLREAQEIVLAIDKLKVREEIEGLIESDVRSRRRIQ